MDAPEKPGAGGVPARRDPEELSDLKSRSVRGGVWAAISATGSSLLRFLGFAVLSRILGPEVFGLMAMVEAFLALGETVLAGGLAEPVIQIRRLRPSHTDTLFWTTQALGLLLVAAAILLRGAVEDYFAQEGLAQLVFVASFVLYVRAAEAVPRALLVRGFRFDSLAKARIGADVLGTLVGMAMGLRGSGVWSLVGMQLSSATVEALLLWRLAGWRPRLRWSVACFRELWRFSASRGLESLLRFVDNQVPRFILGRTVGAAELGYFVFARRLIQVAGTTLLSPVKAVAMPAFAELQDNLDAVRGTYREGTALTATVLFPVFGGMLITAPVLVPLIVGDQWMAAVPLIQVLSFGVCRRTFNLWNSSVLRGLGRPEWLLGASLCRTAVTLTLIFLLLPFGAMGVCVAFLAGTYLSWPITMHFVRRLTGLSGGQQIRTAVPALAAVTLMCGLLVMLRGFLIASLGPWAAAAVLVSVGLAAYWGALAWLGRKELEGLSTLARSIGFPRQGRRRPRAEAFDIDDSFDLDR